MNNIMTCSLRLVAHCLIGFFLFFGSPIVLADVVEGTSDDARVQLCLDTVRDVAIKDGPWGLYPSGDQRCCADNRHSALLGIPDTKLNLDPGHVVAYFGSVCYDKVQEGCCVFENSPINIIASALGKSEIGSCSNTHAGRYCQEVIKGHITAAVRGILCTPETAGSLACKHAVVPGESLPVIIHNNGCLALSFHAKRRNEIGGLLGASSPVQHYKEQDAKYKVSYKPDVTVTYNVPQNACEKAPSGATDSYNLGTDGDWLSLDFLLNCEDDINPESDLAALVATDFQIFSAVAFARMELSDALGAEDCEALKAAEKRLQDELRNAEAAIRFRGREEIINGLKADLVQVREAIEKYCPPVTGDNGPLVGTVGGGTLVGGGEIAGGTNVGTNAGTNAGTSAGTVGGDFVGGFYIATDSSQWCTYTEGNPIFIMPGGGAPTGSSGGSGSSGGIPVAGSGSSGGDASSGGGIPASSGGASSSGGSGSSSGSETTSSSSGGFPSGERVPGYRNCEADLAVIDGVLQEIDAGTRSVGPAMLAQLRELQKELQEECGDSPPPGSPDVPPAAPENPITAVPLRPEDVPENNDEPGIDEPQSDDPNVPTIVIYVKAKAIESAGVEAIGGQQIKLFAAATTNVALPGPGVDKPQTDHNEEPIQGITDDDGNLTLTASAATLAVDPLFAASAYEIALDTNAQSSINAEVAGDPQHVLDALPHGMLSFVSDVIGIGSQNFVTFTFPEYMTATVETVLITIPGIISIQLNFCRDKQVQPNDPLFAGNMAWGQKYDNQWAIKHIGFTGDGKGAWSMLGDKPEPVTVAVIDTGMDWNHLDFKWGNVWRNPGETRDNGIDDDNNGYVDDLIGWDFFDRNNNPWDHDGHGTFVSGVIAAHVDNNIGMAGINPHAKIMVLKALNNFGHTRASYLAKSITYAVDNGARVINMSVGGKEKTDIEQAAIDYALKNNVLVVAAAGNEGLSLDNYGIAGAEGVLTVAATDLADKRTDFSNYGAGIDIAAPGIEVLGLRARRTDSMRDIPGVKYEPGANYVGDDVRYYRASGTSFSAPVVAGVASLLLSKDPELTAAELRQILLQSAQDIETPGIDRLTGFGLIDARAALQADKAFYIDSAISSVDVVEVEGSLKVRILGTADANRFHEAQLSLGVGAEPEQWKDIGDVIERPVKEGVLGIINSSNFVGTTRWTIKLVTKDKKGRLRESRFALKLG